MAQDCVTQGRPQLGGHQHRGVLALLVDDDVRPPLGDQRVRSLDHGGRPDVGEQARRAAPVPVAAGEQGAHQRADRAGGQAAGDRPGHQIRSRGQADLVAGALGGQGQRGQRVQVADGREGGEEQPHRPTSVGLAGCLMIAHSSRVLTLVARARWPAPSPWSSRGSAVRTGEGTSPDGAIASLMRPNSRDCAAADLILCAARTDGVAMNLRAGLEPRDPAAAARTAGLLTLLGAGVSLFFAVVQPPSTDLTGRLAALLVPAALLAASFVFRRATPTWPRLVWVLPPLLGVAAVVALDLMTMDASAAGQVFLCLPGAVRRGAAAVAGRRARGAGRGRR